MGDKNNLSLEEQLKQGMIEPGQALKFNQTIELHFQEGIIDDLKEQNKNFILTESKSEKSEKRHLLVTVEGIHTGMTKNMTFYPGTTLESSVPTWTQPHHKPVIKNHNSHAEPLGRIIESEYVESTLTDKYTVRLKLKITDPDAIEKILDGRYLTLSVGGSAKRVNCSVCGKDLVKEGWCGHSRGRAYEGKTAHWTIGEYTGDEISFVNMPADVHSQVIAVELVTGEGGENVKNGKTKESTEDQTQTGIKTAEFETDMIDNLLDGADAGNQAESNDSPDNPEGAAQTQEGDEGKDNPENPEEGANATDGEETLEEKVARLETELGEANDKVLTLTTERDNALAENTTLTADLTQSKADLVEANKHREAAEGERDTFKEQNLKLARFARRSMAERVVDLRILQGKEGKDFDRETLVESWIGSSSKVLESQIKDLVESGQRTIVQVASPGLAIKDKNSILVDEDGNEVHTEESKADNKSDKPKIRTMKDLTEGMTSYLSRQNY